MKKIILFFAMFAVSLSGCDYYCSLDYKIINQSDFVIDINIHFGNKQTTIEPNNEQIFFSQGGSCTHRGKEMPEEYPENDIWLDAEITIDGEQMPEDIWQRENWSYDSNAKRHGTYTLIVTDDLIQSLKSNN